ncbi:MAG: hypothetical protein ACW968_01300 [Candidatus Thorarchaeota archaeon]
MISVRDPSIAKFDTLLFKVGCVSRAHSALRKHPEGLTLKDLSWFTGLAESTLTNRSLPAMFRFQLVEKIETDDRKNPIYRLKPEPTNRNLSINHDASDRRR